MLTPPSDGCGGGRALRMLRSRKLCWKGEPNKSDRKCFNFYAPKQGSSGDRLSGAAPCAHLRQGSFYAAAERLSALLRGPDSLVWQAAREGQVSMNRSSLSLHLYGQMDKVRYFMRPTMVHPFAAWLQSCDSAWRPDMAPDLLLHLSLRVEAREVHYHARR